MQVGTPVPGCPKNIPVFADTAGAVSLRPLSELPAEPELTFFPFFQCFFNVFSKNSLLLEKIVILSIMEFYLVE